jgi:hypothetical protein
MALYHARYIITWGLGGPAVTWATNDWPSAQKQFESLKDFKPVWLDPSGDWERAGRGWRWTAGYAYTPHPPVGTAELREVTRYDYWSDILWTDSSRSGATVRVLFEGEEYALEARNAFSWFIWKCDEIDLVFAIVRRGGSGEYWAGPTGWENNVTGNLFDTLYRLKHGKDAE